MVKFNSRANSIPNFTMDQFEMELLGILIRKGAWSQTSDDPYLIGIRVKSAANAFSANMPMPLTKALIRQIGRNSGTPIALDNTTGTWVGLQWNNKQVGDYIRRNGGLQ